MGALVALFFVVPAQAHHLNVPKRYARGEVTKNIRPGCFEHSTMKHFYRWAKHKYTVRKRPLTEGQALHVKHLALCLATRDKSDWAYDKKRRWRKRFRARLAMYRLTPYGPCYGGRWAVPCGIIGCESGGSWSAYNPSGAAGPYQIMPMWGRPFPVTSWADKLAHHRIAARIWAGGSGAGNWVCSA